MIGIETTIERLEDGTVVLSVEGELDLDTAPLFESELLTLIEGGAPQLIIDLARCDFVDSTALTALVRAGKHYPPSRRLALVVPNANVLKVFEITHLEHTFAIHPTRQAAQDGTSTTKGASMTNGREASS